MAISDFIYDGYKLSAFNNNSYIIAFFSTDTDYNEPPRNINKTSLYLGNYQPFVYSNYEDTLTFTIGIIKNPCSKNYNNGEISITEMEDLKKWLSRPLAYRFRLNDIKYKNIFWEGTFEIKEEIIGSKRVGAELTFNSVYPFALQDEVVSEGTIEETGDSITINDVSTEIGYIYPEVTIKCLASGDLVIYNEFDKRQTIVNNCKENETISFSKYLQISSSLSSHVVQDDFNYKFLRITNTFYDTENVISFSLPCEYQISYNPRRKVIPV